MNEVESRFIHLERSLITRQTESSIRKEQEGDIVERDRSREGDGETKQFPHQI